SPRSVGGDRLAAQAYAARPPARFSSSSVILASAALRAAHTARLQNRRIESVVPAVENLNPQRRLDRVRTALSTTPPPTNRRSPGDERRVATHVPHEQRAPMPFVSVSRAPNRIAQRQTLAPIDGSRPAGVPPALR